MSFEGYLKTVQEKTGKSAADIAAEAAPLGFQKQAEALAWVQATYGLGHGHANMLAKMIVDPTFFQKPDSERLDAQYQGKKARWKPLYDQLLAYVETFGADVGTDASTGYVSFLRNGKKFAIAQPSTADRFDLGLKLKGVPAEGRFEEAGKWNAMVTHRVQVSDPAQVDDEVRSWLRKAYDAVKP